MIQDVSENINCYGRNWIEGIEERCDRLRYRNAKLAVREDMSE